MIREMLPFRKILILSVNTRVKTTFFVSIYTVMEYKATNFTELFCQKVLKPLKNQGFLSMLIVRNMERENQ